MTIDKDEFGQWRDNPITVAVMARVSEIAEQAKQKWIAMSWDAGNCDPLMLADLRAIAQVASDLANLTYEDIEDDGQAKPERNPSHRIQSADPA